MKQCLIYDSSLRFSKCIYGILALVAFLIQGPWLVLTAGFLMVFGVFSIKLNIFYQFHALFLRESLKDKSEPLQKELGELNFVSIMGGALFFVGFLFLYFEKFTSLAWVLVLMLSSLMFLSCFVGFCLAAAIYVFFKKIFKIN